MIIKTYTRHHEAMSLLLRCRQWSSQERARCKSLSSGTAIESSEPVVCALLVSHNEQ